MKENDVQDSEHVENRYLMIQLDSPSEQKSTQKKVPVSQNLKGKTIFV